MYINNWNRYNPYVSNNYFYNKPNTFSSGVSNPYSALFPNYGVNNFKPNQSSLQMYKVKQSGINLSNALSKLTTKTKDSVFNKKTPVSSDADAMTVSGAVKNTPSNTLPINVKIDQVAKAQVNSGNDLSSNGRAVSSGNYRFEVEIGEARHSFGIEVTASDNNKTIQQKMAAAINNRNIGVKATVKSNTTAGTSSLAIESKTTGTTNTNGNPVFTVRDVTGGLAAAMNVTSISQSAQNAVYSVNNGTSRTSTSNEIDLGNGVKATLKGVSNSVQVNFQADTSEAVSAVKGFVKTLNDVLSDAGSDFGQNSDRLERDLLGMNKTYKSSLEKLGINVKSDGSLSVDEDKLTAAAGDGRLQKFFQSNYGFAKRADGISNNMKNSPNYYTGSGASSYQPPNNSKYFKQYSQYMNAGFLFDAMF